jgi:hypothetical protein
MAYLPINQQPTKPSILIIMKVPSEKLSWIIAEKAYIGHCRWSRG